MKYMVYKHIFPNNKVYIGITTKTNPKERWRGGSGYSNNDLMTKAIKKYGWENIKHEILYKNLTEEEAKQKEVELIKYYKSNNSKYGYNLSSGGESSKGYKHTKEQIQKQIINRKRPTYTKETIQKMSKATKEVWNRPGHREKMKQIFKNIIPRKGYTLSKEHKEKISRTRKVKYIKFVETGEDFRGTRDVSEKLNIDRRQIMRILKNEYGFKSARGLHFEYIYPVR